MSIHVKRAPTVPLTSYDIKRQSQLNDQYSEAMSIFLPYYNFKWVENVYQINFLNIPDNSIIEYILEVDLEYPDELHNLHKYLQ